MNSDMTASMANQNSGMSVGRATAKKCDGKIGKNGRAVAAPRIRRGQRKPKRRTRQAWGRRAMAKLLLSAWVAYRWALRRWVKRAELGGAQRNGDQDAGAPHNLSRKRRGRQPNIQAKKDRWRKR
jgi:hypothetical protein